MKDLVSFQDLLIAYRKAKIDSFKEQGHATAIIFAEYEADLNANLKRLLSKINSGGNDWVKGVRFVGEFTFLIKSVKNKTNERSSATTVIHSDPDSLWRTGDEADIEF